MTIGLADLQQIVDEVWNGMLQLPLAMGGHDPKGLDSSYTVCVHISGQWEGVVRMDCSKALAREVAAALLDLSARSVTTEQERDALGEVCNMTAGSVKAIVPRPSHLSLPSITSSTEYEVSVRHASEIASATFSNPLGSMSIRVLEKSNSLWKC